MWMIKMAFRFVLLCALAYFSGVTQADELAVDKIMGIWTDGLVGSDQSPAVLSVPGIEEGDSGEEEEEEDSNPVVDGVYLNDLAEEELELFLGDQDNTLVSELEYVSLRNHIREKTANLHSGYLLGAQRVKRQSSRPRMGSGTGGFRCSAGRSMFGGSARSGLPTTSGTRTTQNYDRPGNFDTATRDFDAFGPQDRSTFSKPYRGSTLGGQTGTIGNHRITVRDGSSGNTPTLEIRSPRPDGSTHVRKFRYNEGESDN